MAMDYLHKFRTGLFTAVEAVQSALPGNPVLRELDVGRQVASAGPGLVWKVYAARKKSTDRPVSAWVFDKKSIDRWPKGEREAFLDLIRQGVARLTRLRHPRLLTVDTALDESRDSLAFCTEPVWASLANIMGRVDNMTEVPAHLNDIQLEPLELKHGIVQLAEALVFLHNDARQLHRNICPEAVCINERGAWKLSAFDFATQAIDRESTATPTYPCIAWDQSVPATQQPLLDYMAPEEIMAEEPSSTRITTAVDIYALGCLCVALFDAPRNHPPFDHKNNMRTARQNIEKLRNGVPASLLVRVPEQFREDVKMCLYWSPELRPDATQFTKLAYFDDVHVKTLRYFDTLCQMDQAQKAQFFKGLATVLPQLPRRVLLQQVMHWCANEASTSGQADLVPFILPCIFLIAELATEQEYAQAILPHLIPIFGMRAPYQVPLMLLQRMELLLSKTPDDQVRAHVLPLIYAALDSDTPKVQELCLGIIPTVGKLVDRDSMKSQLLPKLLRLATDAQVLSVKVNSLVCIGKLIPNLERWMIAEQVLPALPKVHSKEPGVLMAVLGIYNMVFHSKDSISKDTCAKSALPCIIANSVDSSLNVQQFDAHIALVREMIDKVHTEHRQRLSTLSAMQEDQRSVRDFNEIVSETTARRAVAPEIAGLTTLRSAAQLSTNGAQTLSLEEKKRLAAAKESGKPITPRGAPLQPMSAQPTIGTTHATNPLMPTPAASGNLLGSSKPQHQPKDLTATLMGNMTIRQPTVQPQISPNAFGAFSTASQPINWGNQSFSSVATMNWATHTAAASQPRTNAPSGGGASAFDDLLSLPSAKSSSKTPMNAMKKS